MANVSYSAAVLEMGEVEALLARRLGLDTVKSEIRRAEDIAPVFEALKSRSDSLYVVGDTLTNTNRIIINTLAVAARLPTIYVDKESVEAGGLMSYGPNYTDLFRRAADYVDKFCVGPSPAIFRSSSRPNSNSSSTFTTAKALGLAVPPSLLARADEVIE